MTTKQEIKEVRITIEIGPKGEADVIELQASEFDLSVEMLPPPLDPIRMELPKAIIFPVPVVKLTATATSIMTTPYIIKAPKFKKRKRK